MSTTTLTTPRFPTTHDIAHRLADAARATGFWGAIVLPLIHFPLLAGGYHGIAMVALVANVVAMVVGHEHDPGV